MSLHMATQPDSSPVSLQDKWDVESLYPSWEAWEREMEKIGREKKTPHWPEIAELRKGFNGRPSQVKQLLGLCLDADRHLSKLYVYAHLRHDEDVASETPKQAFGRISSLLYDFRKETAWIEPALLALSEDKIDQLLEEESLKEYAFHIEKIVRLKPYTLSTAEEELMAQAGKALQTGPHAFGAFNNADLAFPPAIDGKGEEHPLTHGTYGLYMRHPDRALRKDAFMKMHQAYLRFENTLCELIQGTVQSHLFDARARKYPSCLDAALFPNQIDTEVYRALIKAVRAHLPVMHRYVALRKKVLKLDEVHPYDLYVPMIEEKGQKYTYDEAVGVVTKALAPLGEVYQEALHKGLVQERWVDRYEQPHKRSGAYSSGCYDSYPYILLNYHDSFNDLMTLAHEAGHSMHSLLSRNAQPYHYSGYSIFVAEVASTFHEALVLRMLIDKAKTKEEKAFLINQQMEGIRTTLFRQTLFAEFELFVHECAEKGIPLTPALLKEKYRKLNEEYYGPDLVIDRELDVECFRIPHFYYDFYVYQYATGISAAHALADKVLKEGDRARDAYLAFLRSGSSDYPLQILQKAGVDMTTPQPVECAMQSFDALMGQLEELLKE